MPWILQPRMSQVLKRNTPHLLNFLFSHLLVVISREPCALNLITLAPCPLFTIQVLTLFDRCTHAL